MANFNVKCPDHYPMKCNLSSADKEYLETPEKYKAFFIFQYNGNDEYLEPVLERYFNNRTWRLFNAGKEAGSGTKFCNVCRYALASDFGIACLTPLNYNVFQEMGLVMGQQKPLLYLYNPTRVAKGKLPFDIDDQIYIQYQSEAELERGLDKQMGLLIDKVELYSEYQKHFRESVQQKVNNLSLEELIILKEFLLENRPISFSSHSSTYMHICILENLGLIIQTIVQSGITPVFTGASRTDHGFTPPSMTQSLRYKTIYEVNPEYRDILREIVFNKQE